MITSEFNGLTKISFDARIQKSEESLASTTEVKIQLYLGGKY